MPMWLLDFCSYMAVALLGISGGFWLRGKFTQTPRRSARRPATNDRKQIAEQALSSLHAATETVRSCVEQHIDCIQTIKRELQDSSATEPAIINNAAASIIAANGLAKHQFDDIQRTLDEKKDEISDCLDSSGSLLLTFASLDRQKHIYRQVLTSLEHLAAELTTDINGHGRRLDKISARLEEDGKRDVARINGAVAQIVDAAGDLQRKVDTTEKKIEQQAESVEMQAVLSHTDLLTSLPNRRAFDAELDRDAGGRGRSMCTVIFVDLDRFAQVNSEYGHQGGDVILRQAAAIIKPLVRGKDLVARFAGDTFALVLRDTTVHDALPVADRIRKLIETGRFSHGHHPLRITASLGIAQMRPDELPTSVIQQASAALSAAKQAGGNLCFRHDGQQCHPVSAAFQAKEETARDSSLTLASMWRETAENDETLGTGKPTQAKCEERGPVLSGRTLFSSNLNRRLSEWKRGGPTVSVLVLCVDQMQELVGRFGATGHNFLRQVLGRLLEAATRDMDERCEFEDGLFAILLPATDEANAMAVADRLRSQVRQCKVRMGNDLWDLTASIGLAHCTVASRVMDIMLSAEAAMNEAARLGGDAVRLGEPVTDEQIAAAQ